MRFYPAKGQDFFQGPLAHVCETEANCRSDMDALMGRLQNVMQSTGISACAWELQDQTQAFHQHRVISTMAVLSLYLFLVL